MRDRSPPPRRRLHYSNELATLLATVDPANTPPRFGSIETVKRCVTAGHGIALLPTDTVVDELAHDLLVQLKPPAARRQHLWLIAGKQQWIPPAVHAIHTLLNELGTRTDGT